MRGVRDSYVYSQRHSVGPIWDINITRPMVTAVHMDLTVRPHGCSPASVIQNIPYCIMARNLVLTRLEEGSGTIPTVPPIRAQPQPIPSRRPKFIRAMLQPKTSVGETTQPAPSMGALHRFQPLTVSRTRLRGRQAPPEGRIHRNLEESLWAGSALAPQVGRSRGLAQSVEDRTN